MQRRYEPTNTTKPKKKVRHSKDDALNELELNILIDSCDDIFDRLVIILSGYEGMREGEIAHMEKEWLDKENGEIVIPSEQPCKAVKGKPCSLCAVRGGIWKPKTIDGVRRIPIRIPAQDTIYRFFNAHNRVGCTRQTVYNHIIAVAKGSELTKKVYPHSLRATAGTLWGHTGISAISLCKVMGWRNITSANPYCKADTDLAMREAKAKDRAYYNK